MLSRPDLPRSAPDWPEYVRSRNDKPAVRLGLGHASQWARSSAPILPRSDPTAPACALNVRCGVSREGLKFGGRETSLMWVSAMVLRQGSVINCMGLKQRRPYDVGPAWARIIAHEKRVLRIRTKGCSTGLDSSSTRPVSRNRHNLPQYMAMYFAAYPGVDLAETRARFWASQSADASMRGFERPCRAARRCSADWARMSFPVR